MTTTRLIQTAIMTGLCLACPFFTAAAQAQCTYQTSSEDCGVVTIYNQTGIDLNYQLRVKSDGEWGSWKSKNHDHPRGGWTYHYLTNAEKIEIRFDRIGGDDEYTEKIYILEFNWVKAGTNICRHKGRAYKFEFDRGGQLLDLFRMGW